MPGGDVAALQGVRVVEKVAELGERVTAHAGDGRPAAGVLGDEVTDHVAPEAVLQAHDVVRDAEPVGDRSEEHTSELQSQSNLVCRLLLEKKKKTRLPSVKSRSFDRDN